MINAQGTEPGKYALSIFDILTKARDVTDTLTSDIDLDPYSGNYDNYAWGGEDVILPWKGKLAIFSVPSANPAKAMQLFKYVGKDNFRRVRKDDNTLVRNCALKEIPMVRLYACYIMIILTID